MTMDNQDPEDRRAIYLVEAIDRLTTTMKELVTLVAKHAQEAPSVPLAPEDFSLPPTPSPEPPKAPGPAQGPAKTPLTAVPPTDALCRCMHQSLTHVDGVGPCTKTSCSCKGFNYMVAPQPTPGSCTGCGCTPAQVKMVPGVLPPICVTCQATAEALKRPPKVPA